MLAAVTSLQQNPAVKDEGRRDMLNTRLGSQKLRTGKYKISNSSNEAKFVYVPSSLLESNNFSVSELFSALEIDVPQLIFQLNKVSETTSWNMKIPDSRAKLYHDAMANQEANTLDPALEHYQGVVRENCKRLLKGISNACIESKAIYRVIPTWNKLVPRDLKAEWVSHGGIPLLAMTECDEINGEVLTDLMERSTTVGSEDNEMDAPVFIDMAPWLSGEKKHTLSENGQTILSSIPHPGATHLIITNNKDLLDRRLKESVPQGVIVCNGPGMPACWNFIEAIHTGSPIFIFKNTGALSDLVVEFLEKAEHFRRRKKTNPEARAIMPFPSDQLVVGHQPNMYLQPFSKDMIEMCKNLNILIENFPDRFNPESVLIIDMFNTSEDQMQDQLTKTMSTVFEGIIEIGGAGPEARRLSYAWNFRLQLRHNSIVQKNRSDYLWFAIVVFTLLATVSPVVYVYHELHNWNNCPHICQLTNARLNLILPLLTTILRGVFALLNPQERYVALQRAASMVETEIYMYRTKVGKYSVVKKGKSNADQADRKGGKDDKKGEVDDTPVSTGNPSKTFSAALDLIWKDLVGSDVRRDAMFAAPQSLHPLEDVHKRIKGSPIIQHQFYSVLQPRAEYIKKKGPTIGEEQDEHEGLDDQSDLGSQADFSALDSAVSRFLDPVAGLEGLTGMIAGDTDEESQAHQRSKTVYQPASTPHDEEDGLSSLTADTYIEFRLLPKMAEYSCKSPPSSWRVTISGTTIILLSVISSALEPFGQAVWIPVVLALSAGVSSWSTHQNGAQKLDDLNNAISQMHQLLVWWSGLTMIEKRHIRNKENLVLTTENIILGAKSALMRSGSDKEDKEEKDED